jgi:hypothetical protein
VPTISSFYGIIVRMFFDDHAPPHFHVQYGEHRATMDIATLTTPGAGIGAGLG